MLKEENLALEFTRRIRLSIENQTFVKVTLSKSTGAAEKPKNIYGRLVEIKGREQLSFTLRFQTRDEVKNFDPEEGLENLTGWLGSHFLNADLFTLDGDFTLLYNRKRKPRILQKRPSFSERQPMSHDRQKRRWVVGEDSPYLHHLGITSREGKVLKAGQKKYRQINKYIEIVATLLKQCELPSSSTIVDMGSGKGYLTFALYDYLAHWKDMRPAITGIELRPNLVELCNQIARDIGFEHLNFVAQDIQEFPTERIDMLIALHACDTATDIALAKGIQANAKIIVVAPCCHRQIRNQMDCQNELKPILDFGILKERQAEILTDGLRALILEANGYRTKVFEFISTEHTSKNLMITAVQGKKDPGALEKVDNIKRKYGIEYHYLEKLLAK